MLYLLVVLPTAVYFGSGPAIFASLAAFLAFDWYHIRPLHTFTVADPEEWIALVLFLVVSIVTAQLAAGYQHTLRLLQARDGMLPLRALGHLLIAQARIGHTLADQCERAHADGVDAADQLAHAWRQRAVQQRRRVHRLRQDHGVSLGAAKPGR